MLKKLVLLAALSLAGCQGTTPISATDISCLAFEPIRASRKDSSETLRQVREHNAAWDALCKGN